MSSWLDVVVGFADVHGLDARVLRVFDRGGNASHATTFHALEAALNSSVDAVYERIIEVVASEVDADQAHVFARRFRSVHGVLSADGTPQARMLRAGLVARVEQIVSEPGRSRAVRVRAAVDYFYSQAALHRHLRGRTHVPSLADLAGSAKYEAIAPGVRWSRVQGMSPSGPQHVCVLRCAADAVRLEAIDAYSAWGARQNVGQQVADTGAVAAVSGGFFLYSEPDVAPWCSRHEPVGLMVQQGRVVHPAVFRRAAVVQQTDGGCRLRVVGLTDHQVRIGKGAWQACPVFTTRTSARQADGLAVVNGRVVAQGRVSVPLNGVVLHGAWPQTLVGEAVRWRLPGVQTALAGGPLLLSDHVVGYDLVAEDFCGTAPPQTFVGDETGDQNLLPRMAVGMTDDRELVFVAVDGRHMERALGLSLRGLGELMAAFGCRHAMNMDGGSSKRMVIEGRVVDLPSTGIQVADQEREPARPLHTALLVYPT